MTSFTFPRYQGRPLVEVLILNGTEDDPNFQWFTAFAGSSDFHIGWPSGATGIRRTGLSLLGLPRLRGS